MVAGTLGSLNKAGSTKMAKISTKSRGTKSGGIDTSKDKLDAAIYGHDGTLTVDNTPVGWAQLASHFKQAKVKLVGIEATGGYERGVMRHLEAAGIAMRRLQPLQVKAFAALRLQRAKTDRIDAVLIAACTHALGEGAKLPPDPRFDDLADHLTFIEQTEEDIARIKTRLEHMPLKRLRNLAEADVRRLQRRREDELSRLVATLRKHADLAARFDLVLSIPTVGERTATALVVRMPELGQVSREQAAALAGLAPFVHESGKRKGQTHIGGGRDRLRKSLYVAAMVGAFRWNPVLKAFNQRLRDRGKPPVSALVACARKLLIMANAVVARGTPWQDRPAHA